MYCVGRCDGGCIDENEERDTWIFVTSSSEFPQEEVDEQVEVLENVDPELETEDPLDEDDACATIGCMNCGRTGGFAAKLRCPKDCQLSGTVFFKAFGTCWGSLGGVGRWVPVERLVNLEHPRTRALSS